jgi:hypothetical protein
VLGGGIGHVSSVGESSRPDRLRKSNFTSVQADMMEKEDPKHGIFAFKPFDFLKTNWGGYGEQINRLK